MPYPRQLNLDDDVKARLCSYLNDEITRHLAERVDYIDEIKSYQRDYWVPESTEQGKTPFIGASRIIIPLTAIAVDTIHARTVNALWIEEPFALCKFRTLTNDHENKFNKWLNYELKHGAPQAHVSLESPVLDLEKFGTGVTKPAYCTVEKKVVRNSPITGKEEEIIVTTKRGVNLYHVPIANYLVPNSAVDPESSPWEGEIHLETPFEVRKHEDSGFFLPDTMEALKGWHYRVQTGNNTQDVRDDQQRMEKSQPAWPKQIEWFEIWLAFDVDEDGKEEEIVVHWHRGANLIMSCVYNWMTDLRRGYILGNFMKVEGRRKGIGICKRSAQFQKIITTLHRQRLDAGTIANMRMFKVHRLANYGPNEPIFPGKMWILDDMTHIESIQTNEVYTSAFANEQAALIYEQQMLGVNELTAGLPQQGTPGTATDTTLRLQEGSKKLNLEIFNIKKFIAANYLSVITLTKQYGSRTLDMYLQSNQEDAPLIQEVIAQPIDLINNSILFELNVIGADSNKGLERTNWMQIAQASQQFMTGIMQLVQVGMPQLVAPIAQEAVLQAAAIYKQFLETYNVREEEKLSMEAFLKNLIATYQQQQASLNGGGNGNRPALPNQPGSPAGQNGPGNIADLLAKSGIQIGNQGAPTFAQ